MNMTGSIKANPQELVKVCLLFNFTLLLFLTGLNRSNPNR